MARRIVLAAALAALSAGAAAAEVVVPTQTIRAGTVVEADLLAFAPGQSAGALTDPRDAIGMEARVNLFPNRPIRARDLGMPTLIRRNERVALIYAASGLRIEVEGRALSRAGAGEPVRVMNMASRSTVTGTAVAEGRVEVR